MNSECPICKGDIGCAQFVQSADDHEESEEVFRLKCGHAFHNACLCRALRSDQGCPMCRGTLEETEIGLQGVQTMQIVVDADGLLTIQQIQDVPDVEGTTFDLIEARQVSEALSAVGTVTSVQVARCAVNKATRAYRTEEHSLFKERAIVLRKTLDQFRAAKRGAFDKVRRKLRRTLKNLKKVEKEEVSKIITGVDLDNYINYDVEPHVGNKDTFGPLKHSFWKH